MISGWTLLWAIPALAALGYGIHRLALYLESRGWLFYLNRRPGSSGSLFLDANSLFDPGARHRLEAERLSEAEEAEREPEDLEDEVR